MSNEIKNDEVKMEDLENIANDVDVENEDEASEVAIVEESIWSKAGKWAKTKALPTTGKILKKAAVGVLIGVAGYMLGQKMTKKDGSYEIEPDDIDNNGDYMNYYDMEPVDTVDLPDTDFSVSDVIEDVEDTNE